MSEPSFIDMMNETELRGALKQVVEDAERKRQRIVEMDKKLIEKDKQIEELRKENGDLHVRFEAMSELIAELDAIVLLLEWVMDESEDWILSGEDLMRINEAIKKVRG